MEWDLIWKCKENREREEQWRIISSRYTPTTYVHTQPAHRNILQQSHQTIVSSLAVLWRHFDWTWGWKRECEMVHSGAWVSGFSMLHGHVKGLVQQQMEVAE